MAALAISIYPTVSRNEQTEKPLINQCYQVQYKQQLLYIDITTTLTLTPQMLTMYALFIHHTDCCTTATKTSRSERGKTLTVTETHQRKSNPLN